MTDYKGQLRQCWSEVASTAPSQYEWRARRLTCNAPVAVLAGLREADGRVGLLVETNLHTALEPRFRFRASGISVDDQRRPREGLRRLAIVLEMAELVDVFETLAADVIDVISAATDEANAFSSATARLEAWQACLNARRGNVSVEQQIGILGELEVLNLLSSRVGHSIAVQAWQGPLDGLHDFYSGSSAVEVKSVLGVGQSIRINNVHQPDRSGLQALAIARPRFVESADALNVTEAIELVRHDIERSAPAVLADFDHKILAAGVVPGTDDLNVRARLSEICFYSVGDGFPWIDPSLLPAAISEIRYNLYEPKLREFWMDEPDVRALMLSMGGLNSDG